MARRMAKYPEVGVNEASDSAGFCRLLQQPCNKGVSPIGGWVQWGVPSHCCYISIMRSMRTILEVNCPQREFDSAWSPCVNMASYKYSRLARLVGS